MYTIAKKAMAGLSASLLLTLSVGACASKGEQWLTDMEQAQKIAKAESKNIFMFYTGSDWCTWCIRLEKEVLDTPEFLKYAKENLVLVELDFPQDDDVITEEQREHNEVWLERFPTAGYPTVYLTDAGVNRYAKTGYRAGGPEAYIEHLEGLKSVPDKLSEVMGQAEKASGLARAEFLDKALTLEGAIVDRKKLETEIVSLLESNQGGQALRDKYIDDTPPIKGDKELMEEMIAVTQTDQSPAEKIVAMGGLVEKYNYIREGDAINGVANTVARLAMMAGDQEKKQALKILNRLTETEGFANHLQANFCIAKGALLASQGDIDAATAEIDRAVELDPKEGYREALMEHINKISDQFAK